jgi:hypothetical protein
MKLYCYLLYKMYRFQKTSRIKHGWFRTTSDVKFDTAAGMTMPFFGWLTFLVMSFAYLARQSGFPLKTDANELIAGGGALIFWALFVWFNYKLFHSARYRQYAREFAAYPPLKRHLGSLGVFILMVVNFVGAFYLTVFVYQSMPL